jgi:nicotinate dehydrogenase subunit A|tara:strand:+ start:146 stop:622 length:477 start_codon:yes stop_codon:yes gene_type:complete
MQSELRCTINGVVHAIDDFSSEPLLFFLRDKIGLRSTRYGCGQGTCGSCTVIIDGEAKMSCETITKDVSGKTIETAEVFENQREHPLVKSFIEFQAGQCGYCLPGILMASKSLLDKKQNLSRLEIAEALDANLCRCGAHSRILDAIEKAYQLSNEKGT